MRIAVAGSGRLAACLMRSLLDSSHEVVALVQNGRLSRGLRRHLSASAAYAFGPQTSVLGMAARNDVPVVWIDRMDDDLSPLRLLEPDVLTLDIEMPRMDGYELTERVRDDVRFRGTPIMMITSRAGQKHQDRAMQAGANAYLTKPYREDELIAEVERLLFEADSSHE